MKLHFLVTIESDKDTRWHQPPDLLRAELHSFAEKLAAFSTGGPRPLVTVKTAPACFREPKKH